MADHPGSHGPKRNKRKVTIFTKGEAGRQKKKKTKRQIAGTFKQSGVESQIRRFFTGKK